VLWGIWAGKLRGSVAAGALAFVVAADLWGIDRKFFEFSAPASQLYADDALITKLRETKPPFRVFDVPGRGGVYDGSWLMAHRVQGVFGYHGNEVRFYDELWGGKNQWTNLANPNLWNLFAVRYLLLREPQALPGFHPVGGPMTTTAGAPAQLYERDTIPAYARVIGAAAKVPEAQVVPTLIDQRFPIDDVVLFADTASVQPAALPGGALPPRPAVQASVADWEPGGMRITLDGTAPATTYLLVSETWYPDWHATVDGRDVPVHRADHAAIGIELPAGAKEVVLSFASPAYRTGKLVTLVSTLLTLGLLASPLWWRRSPVHA
jgi:hypothetical protein